MEQVIAKLYVHGILQAPQLSRAARVAGVSLESVLQELERLGVPRQQVFQEAVTPASEPSSSWSTFTLDEAIEALYNRALPNKELAAKLGKTEKAVSNFRWRAFRQGFLVPRRLWEAVIAGNQRVVQEYGWRGEFAVMLYELTRYATARKLTPPKVELTED
ncbi:hypothetical protein [Thermus phage TSP4]|nr:hypothetical protein [Thermus phage TSP4]